MKQLRGIGLAIALGHLGGWALAQLYNTGVHNGMAMCPEQPNWAAEWPPQEAIELPVPGTKATEI